MKKKLVLVVIVVLAVLGTLLTEHLIKSSKESAEMEEYRQYLNKNYIPLTNKMNNYLNEADQSILVSSWYNFDNGFLDGLDLQDDIRKIKEELIKKDAKYPKTQELKKTLLDSLENYTNELSLIDTGSDADDIDVDDEKVLKTTIEGDMKLNKDNVDKIYKLYK